MAFRIILLSLILSITLLAKEFKVGVLYWSMNIAGQVAMKDGLEQMAKELNVKLIPFVAGDGADGIEKQIKQFNKLIEMEVDAIIVQPTDNAALASPLLKANKKKIPVIAYDQYIFGGELKAFVTSNNYQAGFLDGEYVASKFPENKELNIILVEYPHVSSTVERVNGFLDALYEFKQKYKIVKTYEAVEPKQGKKAGKDILKDFPKKGSIDVIFTINDGGGLSVVEELRKAKRDEIFVATIDGDPKSVENIKNGGLIKIDSAQFCGPLGAEAMKITYNVLLGKKVANYILVPTFPVTKETLSIYPGWMGPIPKSFVKPWNPNSFKWNSELKVVE